MVASHSTTTALVTQGQASPAQALNIAPPSGPLSVTNLDVSSWQPRYPTIGQFAMTESQDVIAAGPDGLFSFKRVHDHGSKPWSQPRPFPPTRLDSSCISGIALYEANERLTVFCVANGAIHSFSRSSTNKDGKGSPEFVADSSPPLPTYRVSGTPCITAICRGSGYSKAQRWSLVVPSKSGGLLHTSTTGPTSPSGWSRETKTDWEPVDHVAANLGIISAVCITAFYTGTNYDYSSSDRTDIVAVCIVKGRLHSVEGPFSWPHSIYSSPHWKGEITARIHHPGEVTGNPALLNVRKGNTRQDQLDLLVPSAEGGIFHFVRTPSTPDEWHMIGRIGFPSGLPAAGSLAFFRYEKRYDGGDKIRAALQIGGKLYIIQTKDGSNPWARCLLNPVTGPGPAYGYD